MLLRLINGAASRKVDSGLKILIEPSNSGQRQATTTKKITLRFISFSLECADTNFFKLDDSQFFPNYFYTLG